MPREPEAVPLTDRVQTPEAFPQESPRVRTRGPIRNLDSAGLAATAVLSELIKEIRRQVGGLPITITIHGQDVPSKVFLERLSAALRSVDSLWLIADGATPHPAELPTFGGMVSLNLSQEQDARLYRNLFSDLAFFSASDGEQVSLVAQLRNKSRVAIIYRQGNFSNQLLAAIVEAGDLESCITTICFWDGAEKLEAAGTKKQVIGGDSLQAANLQAIGRELKGKAILWERQQDRRINFRAVIQSLYSSSSSPSFLESLVWQADADDWPAWAVQSIGPLYLPIVATSDGRTRALVWHHLLNCVADRAQVEVVKELCGGQIQEALLTPVASELLSEIDRNFQEGISTRRVASDRAFFALFAHILQEVEICPETDPETAQRLKEVREGILYELGLTRES